LKANLSPIDQDKKNAGFAAAQHVKDGFIVGLGSGSTAAFVIEALGQRIIEEHFRFLVFLLLIRLSS